MLPAAASSRSPVPVRTTLGSSKATPRGEAALLSTKYGALKITEPGSGSPVDETGTLIAAINPSGSGDFKSAPPTSRRLQDGPPARAAMANIGPSGETTGALKPSLRLPLIIRLSAARSVRTPGAPLKRRLPD